MRHDIKVAQGSAEVEATGTFLLPCLVRVRGGQVIDISPDPNYHADLRVTVGAGGTVDLHLMQRKGATIIP